MNFKIIYVIGSFLLFVGLLWMLLPHSFHEEVISHVDEDSLDISHTLHILQGLIPAILGLILMIYAEKKLKITAKKLR